MPETTAVKFLGVHEFQGALKGFSARAQMASVKATDTVAAALIRQAKMNATGPARKTVGGARRTRLGTTLGHREGGPGVVTGALRNSIRVVSKEAVGWHGYKVVVAPTVIYSRRLELGFHGTDSLGRHYNQPPYPYFGPALRFVATVVARPAYRAAWAAAARA